MLIPFIRCCAEVLTLGRLARLPFSVRLRGLGIAWVVSGALALNTTIATADSLLAWGEGMFGQLGNGMDWPMYTPFPVIGMNEGVTGIATGSLHSLAIQNGAAFAWGDGGAGQLGNGAYFPSYVPVPVSGLTSGVTAVAGGSLHSFAIRDGALWAWGANNSGALGTGKHSNVPLPVVEMTSGVTEASAGHAHSLAIQNGAAWAWGANSLGELGIGTNNPSIEFPVPVTGMTSGVTSVAAADAYSLAVKDGAAWAWGRNNIGQLGNGTTNPTNVPVPVAGMTSGVTAVAAATFGARHSLAIKDGDVYAWGDNLSGQLGNGTTTPSAVPVLALDLPVDIVEITAGQSSSFALASNGSLWVWGYNLTGQLGLGDIGNLLTPTQLLPPEPSAIHRFTSVASNGLHTLAMFERIPDPPGGDFNGDWIWDCADVDALVVEIVAGTHDLLYDLTDDGFVTTADLSEWLALAGGVNLSSGNPYLRGDANLDGLVDGSDFGIWNSAKFTQVAAWCRGDFNADGVVDGSDFGLWNSNKFSSADSSAAVPEPGNVTFLTLLAFALVRRCRR